MEKCFNCMCEMEKVKTQIHLNWKGKYPITIGGVEAFRCPKCNEEYFDNDETEMLQQLSKTMAESIISPKPDFLNVEEVADLLRISEQSVYNMIKDGRIKAFKAGREWRFRREDVLAATVVAEAASTIAVAARGKSLTENDLNEIKDIIKERDRA